MKYIKINPDKTAANSISSSRQDWADKNRADTITTTVTSRKNLNNRNMTLIECKNWLIGKVVIVIVIAGLTGMVASCFVWNKKKQQLEQKVVSVASQSPVVPTPHVTWTSPLPPTTVPRECCKFQ